MIIWYMKRVLLVSEVAAPIGTHYTGEKVKQKQVPSYWESSMRATAGVQIVNILLEEGDTLVQMSQ